MKTITTTENQTIFDIAVQHYGNVEAVQEILQLNPQITNDTKGYNVDDNIFQFDLPVRSNSQLTIDEDSIYLKKDVLREINETVITFETWQEN